MTRRGICALAKTRQNKFLSATGAAWLTATSEAIRPVASPPSVPTASTLAALFTRQTDSNWRSLSCDIAHSQIDTLDSTSGHVSLLGLATFNQRYCGARAG